MSLQERMSRLLFIVPYVASRDGVPLVELAEKLGVKPAQIEADLDLLAMVGQPPLTPDHLIDLYVEDDIVYVDLDQSLTRPPQLTHEEARALVLGATLVGKQGGLGEALERVLEKITLALNPVDRDMVRSLRKRVGIAQDGDDTAGLVRVIEDAIDGHEELNVDYYSASSDQKKTYRLQPLARITHSGAEYLVALDAGADLHEKLFRLDRMGTVAKSGASFVPPKDFDLEKFRKRQLYLGKGDTVATVRFAAAAAPLVVDRFPQKDVTREDDGALTVKLSTSSAAWLLRWVLPLGVNAEVVGPREARDTLAKLCNDACKAYGRIL